MSNLKHWSDVVTIVSGKNQKNVVDVNGEYPIYGSGGIMGYASDYLCEAGTTIVGRKGTINKPIFVNRRFWNVDTAFGITPGEELNPKYLYYFCQYFNFAALDKSTTIPSLAKRDLLAIEMPVPSLEGQQRIVARIEELFSQLDDAEATLQKTKAQLALYRQAVLKAAFDAAIQTNAQTMSINQLLCKERKGMTTGPFGTMLNKKEHKTCGVPVLGIENIGEGLFIPGSRIFVTPEKAKELKAFEVKSGDLIISRSGTVGEICEVPDNMEGALLSTNLMRISLNTNIIKPKYFIWLFRSKSVVIDQVKELCKGSTRAFLNQTILKQISFPVPSIQIQEGIVDALEMRLSLCESIEKTINQSFKQVAALRQCILKSVF